MIGITGGIASGKSLVAKRLKMHGALVLDSDIYARDVVEPHTPGWLKVKEAFPEVIQADSSIDRNFLGEIVFTDPKKRKRLESIIHPLVLAKLKAEAKQGEAEGRVVFADVPLLYEAGWERYMRAVWVVYVRPEIQLQRLMARNGISKHEAELRIASQLSLAEKKQRASAVIDNNGSKAETYRQVDALWKELEHEYSLNRP